MGRVDGGGQSGKSAGRRTPSPPLVFRARGIFQGLEKERKRNARLFPALHAPRVGVKRDTMNHS